MNSMIPVPEEEEDPGGRIYFSGAGRSLIEEDQGNYYNTFLLLDRDGNQLGAYRKILLFRFLEEERYFRAGSHLVLIDSPWGSVGLATCYDLRFPEVYAALVERDAQVLLVPSAFTVPTGTAHWHTLLKGTNT